MVFTFPGEYFPAGYYFSGTGAYSKTYISTWIYNPSDFVEPATSPTLSLVVQKANVLSWPNTLPTGYWSQPVDDNNRLWGTVAGNYPWLESIIAGTSGTESVNTEWYGPFVPAVNTPHIVWDTYGAMSGIVGGETGNYAIENSPVTFKTPSVIYMGRGYATVTKSINGGAPLNYAECYNIQTGQIYYDILATSSGGTGVTPTWINYNLQVDPTDPGHAAEVPDLVAFVGNAIDDVNPNTGQVTSYTLPNLGVNGIWNFFYYNGYFLSFEYNSSTTSNFDGVPVTLGYQGWLLNWTENNVLGSATTPTSTPAQILTAFDTRLVGNVSVYLPESFRTLYEPNFGYGYGAYDPVNGISITENRFIYGGFYGSFFEATSFVNKTDPIGGSTSVIWNVTTPVGDLVDAYRPTNGWIRDGIYAVEMERGFILGMNEFTGATVWNTTIMTASNYPWSEFWLYDEAAYGQLLYAIGYTGVWALNETNGNIVWHTDDPAPPFETSYESANGTSDYAIAQIRVLGTLGANNQADPDGIVYVADGEHSTIYPQTRGWGLVALNATTGAYLWKVDDLTSIGAGADGYLMTSSVLDGIVASLGKGLSKITVSAPQTAITAGQKVIISGTSVDMSPAQPGTALVSDASMGTWMDYLHFQEPIGGIFNNITVTGVPIVLNAVDPNNNLVSIGTATSNIAGTWSYTWTAPTTPGTYQISAVFAGSNAYGSSSSETSLVVVAPPTTSATPTPTAAPSNLATTTDLITYIVIAVIVLIIAIAIVGVLLLRKHA
jgi:hypothetical protein